MDLSGFQFSGSADRQRIITKFTTADTSYDTAWFIFGLLLSTEFLDLYTEFLKFWWKQKATQPCQFSPSVNFPLSLSSCCCWPELWALHKQIRTRTISPIAQLRSNFIWLLHYVSSPLCRLLHRLLSPCVSTRLSSLFNKHRTLWPNSALITTQKAHYKTPDSSQKVVAEREGGGLDSLREKKRVSHWGRS